MFRTDDAPDASVGDTSAEPVAAPGPLKWSCQPPLADGVSVARPAFAWLADAPLRLWQSVYQEKLNVFTWASTEEGSTTTRPATARTSRGGRRAWVLRGRFEKHPKEWQLSCRRPRLALQGALDLVEVLLAVRGAERVDRAARRGIRGQELVLQPGHPRVGCLGGGDGQPSGRTWRQREQHRFAGVVDPVHVVVSNGAGDLRGSGTLPRIDQDDDPLIPERQVSQHSGDRPARWHRGLELFVAGSPDELAEAVTLGGVLGDVRAVGGHAAPPERPDRAT